MSHVAVLEAIISAKGTEAPTVRSGRFTQRLLWEARSDNWQITDTRQTCPNHWHVKCALCGRTADMTLHRLVQAGWADAAPHPMPPSKYGSSRHWLAYAARLACPECSLRLDLMDWLADHILAADDNPRAWDLSRAAARMLDDYKTGGSGSGYHRPGARGRDRHDTRTATAYRHGGRRRQPVRPPSLSPRA